MAKIAFIGLGVMGAPIAGHLAAAGHEMFVYNRTHAKAEAWANKYRGTAVASLNDLPSVSVAITCVGTDADLEEVVFGRKEQLLIDLSGGGILIDHSTVSASLSRRIAERASDPWAVDFIDAPVSGGQAGAENGALSVMCGARNEQTFQRASEFIAPYAARIVHVGAPGAGQTTKMVNQICIAGVLQGVSEGLRFAQASQLDLDKVFEAISGGAAQSWQMVNRWPTMARGEFDFGFAIDWMRKDLGLALDEANRNGALLPMTALVDQFYAEVQRMGGARQDTSALVRRLPK